jgi:hypothetical protein
MSKIPQPYERKQTYFLKNISLTTGALASLSPLFNIGNAVSTRCMSDNTTPRQAARLITNNWKNPGAFFDGIALTTAHQVAKSLTRNGIWFKKAEIDEAFPGASKYVIPTFVGVTEIGVTPITVKLTRLYTKGKTPIGLGEHFLGATPAAFKIAVTTAIYLQVKPCVDYVVNWTGVNADSMFGSFISALPISIPVTLFTHPFERVKRNMQFDTTSSFQNNKASFFGATCKVLVDCKLLAQEKGLKEAIGFAMRGWQPCLMNNIMFTIVFNIMILVGKQDIGEILTSNSNGPRPTF